MFSKRKSKSSLSPHRLVRRSIALPLSSSGQFNMPMGVAANRGDELFVADRQTRKIHQFSAQGKLLASFGAQNNRAGRLSHPEAIAVATDRLFVVDTGNHCVQVSE